MESGRIEKWKEENNIDEQEEEEEVACSGSGEANLMMAEGPKGLVAHDAQNMWKHGRQMEVPPRESLYNLFLFAPEMDDLIPS